MAALMSHWLPYLYGYIESIMVHDTINPNTFHGGGGKGAKKSPEGGREGGEKKHAGGPGLNPGPTTY